MEEMLFPRYKLLSLQALSFKRGSSSTVLLNNTDNFPQQEDPEHLYRETSHPPIPNPP